MPLSCNCRKKMSRYDTIILFLRCQRQHASLGFVIRNASSAWRQNCLVTMALYFCFAVPAPIRLFWVIVLCTISVFFPIENPHLTILDFGKFLRVYTQPAINLGSMYAQTSNACLSHARMAFRTFLMHPTLFSVETMQNDIWITLQKIILSTQHAVCYPPDFPSILIVFRATQPVHQLSEQRAVHRPGPDDVSESL